MDTTSAPPSGVRAYRAVPAEPRLRRLVVVALFARVPATATATLTLHVVLAQHLGYAAAGLMVAVGGALATSGTGAMIDRWSPSVAVLVVGGTGVAGAGMAAALAGAGPRNRVGGCRRAPP